MLAPELLDACNGCELHRWIYMLQQLENRHGPDAKLTLWARAGSLPAQIQAEISFRETRPAFDGLDITDRDPCGIR